MDGKEVMLLFLLVLLVAVFGLVLLMREGGPTGELISPQLRQTIFEVPNVELPFNGESLRQPFAGRCKADRDAYVTYLVEYKATTEYAFDGCYEAWDGKEYFFDFYCEGNTLASQVWVEISHDCKDMPRYELYSEASGDYPY